MRSTTIGEDVFEHVKHFFKENGLQWSKLEGCTADGTTAMLGRKLGFQSRAKAVSPSVISVHCFTYRFALAAKLLPPNRKTGLNLVVKMATTLRHLPRIVVSSKSPVRISDQNTCHCYFIRM